MRLRVPRFSLRTECGAKPRHAAAAGIPVGHRGVDRATCEVGEALGRGHVVPRYRLGWSKRVLAADVGGGGDP